MVCSKPHLVCFVCPLSPKELLTSIEPSEWIFFSIISGKLQLVVAWYAGGVTDVGYGW
jgi:hypothetical protein